MKAYLFILTIHDGTFESVVANNVTNAVARLARNQRCVESRRFVLPSPFHPENRMEPNDVHLGLHRAECFSR